MTYIDGKWRQSLHLEPPHGWLNDPNGLCFFNGFYHVYFQYSPNSPNGSGRKCWGHYRSTDLIKWEFTGTVLFPDTKADKDGVYSGCAVVYDDTLHIFYTGNVKEDGNHDFITSGRGANVIHVTSRDGVTVSPKEILLRNEDYPDFCSCHVRDPKVWKEDEKWHIVLGARTLDDRGCVLFYTSDDLVNWKYDKYVSVADFGYMWECPDAFELEGHKYLSISPQGLKPEELKYQNVYQSGYFLYEDGLSQFTEWDMGFDFYAPQTFEAPDGRRILIGWMGIGDIPYGNPTTKLGYQHCLTIPRELSTDINGRILQNPVTELLNLRQDRKKLSDGECLESALPFELTANVNGRFNIDIENSLHLEWDGQIFTMSFTNPAFGGGRTIRRASLNDCRNIQLIADRSSIEIYLNDGSLVFGSRMYPDGNEVKITVHGINAAVFNLKEMEVNCLGE